MRWISILSPALAGLALTACGSPDKLASVAVSPTDASPGAPMALVPRRSAPQSVTVSVNQDDLNKAVEQLRATRRKAAGPFDQAGADLNSDGRAEALVLLTGQDWCSPQGCTLMVFQPDGTGYRPVSETIGVKAPVAAGSGSNAGWRDLIVRTGADKTVRLQYAGGIYPVNAETQAEASADLAQAEVLIQPGGNKTAAAGLSVPATGAR
jgi:hypothetical protein